MAATFVTTMDNPWDYFTEFDEWYAFDTGTAGYSVIGEPYNTLNYVARVIAELSDTPTSEMSDDEYNAVVNEAVDEICKLNLTGNYKKVYEKEK